LRQGFSTPLTILLVTASLMLLMACANVAALLVARSKARQREIGVRLAIGAPRARVIRQLLTESSLLSACGGMLGLAFAYWGAPALLALIVGRRQPTPLNVSPDGVVLAFAAAVSLGTGVLFGLAPALRVAREDLASQLKEAARSSTPRGALAKALVGLQIALSVVLLFGAGLFVRTLRNLDGQNLGFRGDNLLLFDIDPVRSGYTGERGIQLHNQIAERIGKIPGVASVTYVQEALISGSHNSTPMATDGGVPIPAGQPDEDFFNRVGPQFFETMRMRIVLGRGIEWRDTNGEHPAAVVNESWARTHFPNENPVGRHLSAGGDRFDPQSAYEIVGVAEDAKYNSMRDTPPRTVYLGYGEKWARARRMCFVVRSAASPAALMTAIKDAVHEIDPVLPVYNARTQRQQIAEAMGTERTLANVSSFFGALLLVSVGVYGTLSYAVTRRTGEIGIRMALGARRRAVVWMILRESLGATALGLAAGLSATLALSRYAESVLFGIGARDGVLIATTIGALGAITAFSGFLPANRAARIDPIRALRHE
jgi:predicted permease